MGRLFLAFCLFLAIFIAFTPPGVCPCWLMADPGHNHPHLDGHPEKPHRHDYLIDLFQSQAIVAAPLALMPLSLLIALLAANSLWRRLSQTWAFTPGWNALPITPPPRLRLL